MEQDSNELQKVLIKVEKKAKDPDLAEFTRKLLNTINNNPKLEIHISDSDNESIVYTSQDNGRPLLTTLGRLMTRQLKFDPQEYSLMIQILADAYLAEIRQESVSYDIANGKDIMEAYKTEWGAHSCMTGENCKLSIFLTENPDTISILLFKNKSNKGLVKARALLWKTIEGDRVLDRIYPNSGWHIEVIKAWAKKEDIITRKGNSLPEGDTISLSNNKKYRARVINTTEVWSYMDTFSYGSADTNGAWAKKGHYVLSNSYAMNPSPMFYLWTTGGCALKFRQCSCCQIQLSPSYMARDVYESRFGDRVIVCDDCYKSKTFICRICEQLFISGDKSSTLCDRCKAKEKNERKN